MTSRQSTILTVIGFLLFILGLFSLTQNLVGLDLAIFRWIYDLGQLTSFLIRMGMVLIGIIMIYVGRVDWSQERI
ncbi:MAG: hypothetical protein AAGF87_04560 [Bacteroidota bacterium]